MIHTTGNTQHGFGRSMNYAGHIVPYRTKEERKAIEQHENKIVPKEDVSICLSCTKKNCTGKCKKITNSRKARKEK